MISRKVKGTFSLWFVLQKICKNSWDEGTAWKFGVLSETFSNEISTKIPKVLLKENLEQSK